MSQSLLRALDLLGALAKGPATLDELASTADVHKTTVMRLLHSLEDRNFVIRDAQQRYRLGSQLFQLSSLALEQRDIRGTAHPHLQRLNEATGHTIHLAALEGRDVVYIDKLESRHPVRMYSRIGLTAALNAAAVAKVIMADMPQDQLESLTAGIDYPRFTENTLTDQASLLKAIEQAGEQGWALDDQEFEEFVHCIAAPIRDASGGVVAAVSCSVPTVMLDREGLLGLLPALLECTRAISAELGHTAP
ncbi:MULTISPECIES: IclR family transcriptional regulator [Arthrobacter]|uniref:IclR family transcriptional regulator n=2 Tax=Arthrobacter TaxID=1663 RepID=A0ABU9KFY1_9MICC|nr:IclR family transcriptional regulator [Arthrobacter sp. YJM1]MDP5225787.1 IclR family transcriptional regulator [Arthrobacter sp. YJM1]